MKTLTNYINEGLISDIILKLLDASLSWLGGASKWIGDNLTSATAEIWKTSKSISASAWDELRTKSGVKGQGAPKNERECTEMLVKGLLNEPDADKRNKGIDDFVKKNLDPKAKSTANFYLTTRMESAMITLSDPNASDKQKKEAENALKEIAAKSPAYAKKIDAFMLELSQRNKQENNTEENQ